MGHPTVYAQKLQAHDRRTERLEAGLEYALGGLLQSLRLKREVVGHVPTLVVAMEEEEGS
jgi:hypothetical protein